MKKIFCLVVMTILFGGSAFAADFGLSLSKAVANIPPGADVMGMGNCWVATPDFSSNNPAVLSIESEGDSGGVSVTYGLISFDKGPDINLYSATATAFLPVGVLQMSYSDAKGRKSPTLMSADMEIDSVPTLELQYGFKAGSEIFAKGDELHLGVGYAYGESEIRFHSLVDIEEVGSFRMKSASSSKSHSASVGAVYRPNEKVNLGIFYRKSWSDDNEKLMIAELELAEKYSDKSQADQLRAGIGWQALDMTFIAVDYQYLDFDGEGSSQWFAGIEQGIIKDTLYVYVGVADESPTVGLGLYFKNGGINLAYMHDFSRDLESHLGKSDAMMATVYFNF